MKKILTRTGQILAGTLAIPVILLGMLLTLSVHATPSPNLSVCHPVNGEGETKSGWTIIEPDKASSHIDESKYPDGDYWQHTAKDGRHDIYADEQGNCPSVPEDDPEECPDGQVWRGGCVTITNCPYGDTIPMEDCDKHKPDNEVENTTPTPVETQETEVFYGK